MVSIVVTIFIFLITFFLQLFLTRIFRRLGIHTFASFVIHCGGLLIVTLYVMPHVELPYTSMLVYILLTLLLITFSFVPLLGQQSPSSIIMTMLQQRPHTVSVLVSAFDEKFMILRRIEDLVKLGLVNKSDTRYVLSPLGIFFARVISLLCTLMGLNVRG